MRIILLVGLSIALAGLAGAQTTYPAPTGTIQSTNATVMNLAGGGSVSVSPNFGPNCYYPGPCAGPGNLTYILADGTTGTVSIPENLLEAVPNVGQEYTVSGTANGFSYTYTFTARGHSGRGGGITKTYINGAFTVPAPSCVP